MFIALHDYVQPRFERAGCRDDLTRVERLAARTGVGYTISCLMSQLKSANGCTGEQIQRKRASLEGVLVPVVASWNEELLRAAGFRQIDCF